MLIIKRTKTAPDQTVSAQTRKENMFKGLTGLSSLWSQDAKHLGTANTSVVLKEQGVVLNELVLQLLRMEEENRFCSRCNKNNVRRTSGNISAIRPLKMV